MGWQIQDSDGKRKHQMRSPWGGKQLGVFVKGTESSHMTEAEHCSERSRSLWSDRQGPNYLGPSLAH